LLLWRDLQSLPGLLLWPLATALLLAGAWLEAKDANPAAGDRSSVTGQRPPVTGDPAPASGNRSPFTVHRSPLTAHWDLVLLFLILLVAAWARFHQLDVYPNGCQSDECNNGLDALRWLGGAPYTPYAETNEGQATFFTYLIALSFRVFGVGVEQMRYVSAAVGVLTVAAFYFLARDLYGRRAGLAAAAMLAGDRWHITFSRIVYELIMQPLFMVLLFFFLLRALREGRRRDWALAGVMLAAGLNTYTAFRVVPILVAAFLVFWAVRTWLTDRPALRHDLQGMGLMAAAAAVAVLPLGVYVVQNWDVFTSRMRHISVMRDVERVGSLQPILDNLRKTLYMFNWQGDLAALNNLPGAPMLGTLVGVLFVLGLGYSLWHGLRGRPIPVLYAMWFVAVASLAVLSVAHEAPTARRTIGMVPLVYLLVALVTDQLLRRWDEAWYGLGRRWFELAVAAAAVAVMAGGIRTYFQVQAPHPDVWAAYSPNESAVGRYLASLPGDATVLITPQYEHHSAVKLIGRDHPYRALNPVDDLPYRGATTGDLVYVLEPVDLPLLSLLEQIYPTGRGEVHRDRYDRPLFLSYQVPQADLAATQGIVGRFYTAYPPVTAPEAEQTVASLDLDLAAAPLAPPFFALWEGTLLAPAYGEYAFDLLAEGEAATLQIGQTHRLDLPAGGAGRLTATLAAGFHPLRLEYRAAASAGRLRLTWSGPGFGPQPVGSPDLFTFKLGGQGLVGYYFPNAEWAGEPAIVRNDLLIVANNPLPEPFSILWRGKIAIPESGLYVFGTRSDDGSFVFINGQLVVDNGGSHGAQDRQGSIYLEQGFHDIEVRYNQYVGGREMQLYWQPPGQGQGIVDSRYLFPLEGAEIPAGLALPPPPIIAQAPAVPAVAPPVEQPGRPAPQLEAPAVRPRGDFPTLAAEVLWTVGDACGGRDGEFSTPRGVAMDPATGDLFVVDTGNGRIVRLSTDGQWLGSFGQAGMGPDQFQEAFDIAVEPTDTVLVLDAVAQQLLRFTADGRHLATFGAEYTFYRPRGLDVNPAGQIVIADTGGVRILRLGPGGDLLGQIGGPGSDLAQGQPTDAASTPQGEVYFVEAETGVVTRVGADGAATAWLGPAPASTLDGPHLALRPAGGLYVTDPEGRRVLLFDRDGGPLGQFGAEAGLVKPVGIAAAQAGAGVDRVAVVDSHACRVLLFQVSAP
ncbi:MAG: PA14 domain-containing protein, partial [Caldilineales bacterium]|nr:PA14 domain-containing protein [Caldilineales bacterium]